MDFFCFAFSKEDKSSEREGLWTEHFFIENYKNSLKDLGEYPLPILSELTNRVLHAANSVQLLLRLDRLREAPRHSGIIIYLSKQYIKFNYFHLLAYLFIFQIKIT